MCFFSLLKYGLRKKKSLSIIKNKAFKSLVIFKKIDKIIQFYILNFIEIIVIIESNSKLNTSNHNSKMEEKLSKGKRTNKKFTTAEDERLRQLVREYGEYSWAEIAKQIKTRNLRQCHDRWFYYLSPKVNNSPWSEEEDEKLIRLSSELQGKWVQIAKRFKGRNDTQIKNRWNILKKTRGLQDVRTKNRREKAQAVEKPKALELPVFQPDQFGTIDDILSKLSADMQLDGQIASNELNDFFFW